jgi:hypothetical protein
MDQQEESFQIGKSFITDHKESRLTTKIIYGGAMS